VDHFTKYIWVFSLKRKSDVVLIFINFRLLVEKYSIVPILTVYSDGGGEYEGLTKTLSNIGIQHLFSPPTLLKELVVLNDAIIILWK